MFYKLIFILSLCTFLPRKVFSNEIIIAGKIIDKDKYPILGANISLINNTIIGTVSDENGNFSLTINDTLVKNDTLRFEYLGMQTIYLGIYEFLNNNNPIVIKLTEDVGNTIDDVVIKANLPISDIFAVQSIDKINVYLNPNANADPIRAISSSVSSTNTNESANLNLRGLDYTINRIFLNEVPVYKAIKFSQLDGTGRFSVFNNDVIKQTNVFANNAPIEYNNTSGAVASLTTENKTAQNIISIGISVATLGAKIFYGNKKWNIIAGINHLNSVLFTKINPLAFNKDAKFNSTDVLLNISFSNKNLSFNFFNYILNEQYNFRNEVPSYNGISKYKSIQSQSIVNLKYVIKKHILSLNGSFSTAIPKFNFGNLNTNDKDRQIYISTLHTYYAKSFFSIKTGFTFESLFNKYNDLLPFYHYAQDTLHPTYLYNNNNTENIIGLYHYQKIQKNKFNIGYGIRANYTTINKTIMPTVQLNIAYNINFKHKLLFATGYYTALILPSASVFNYQQSRNIAFSLDYNYSKNKLDITAACYYNFLRLDSNYNHITGIEFNFSKSFFKYFQFQMSLNYLYSIYTTNQHQYYYNKNGNSFFIKALLQYNNPKILNASITYQFHLGEYYTPIQSSVFDNINRAYIPIYSNAINSKRLKNYNLVNISLSKIIDTKKLNIISYLSFNNILNTKNQEKLLYKLDYSTHKFDYFSRFSFFIGCVINIKYSIGSI